MYIGRIIYLRDGQWVSLYQRDRIARGFLITILDCAELKCRFLAINIEMSGESIYEELNIILDLYTMYSLPSYTRGCSYKSSQVYLVQMSNAFYSTLLYTNRVNIRYCFAYYRVNIGYLLYIC